MGSGVTQALDGTLCADKELLAGIDKITEDVILSSRDGHQHCPSRSEVIPAPG